MNIISSIGTQTNLSIIEYCLTVLFAQILLLRNKLVSIQQTEWKSLVLYGLEVVNEIARLFQLSFSLVMIWLNIETYI